MVAAVSSTVMLLAVLVVAVSRRGGGEARAGPASTSTAPGGKSLPATVAPPPTSGSTTTSFLPVDDGLTVLWKLDLEKAGLIPIGGGQVVTIKGDRVVLATAFGSLVAFNAADGTKLWDSAPVPTAPTGRGGAPSSTLPHLPTIRGVVPGGGDQVLTGDGFGSYGLDARDGRQRWFTTDSLLDGPAGADAVFATVGKTVQRVDLATGTATWSTQWVSSPFAVTLVGDVLIGMESGPENKAQLEARDARTGSGLWVVGLPVTNGALFGPAGDLLLVVGLGGGPVMAVRPADGTVVWNRAIPGRSAKIDFVNTSGARLIANAHVAVIPSDDGLVAIDPSTGDVRWTYGSRWWLRSGFVDDERVVLTGDGGLLVLDARDGRALGRRFDYLVGATTAEGRRACFVVATARNERNGTLTCVGLP